MGTNSLPPELLNTVHCMDCLEFMKTLPDKCIDLVLTDPPYGIDYNNDKLNRKSSSKYDDIIGDKGINYSILINELLRVGKTIIIFGAINFFYDLPYKGIRICWDKRTTILADNILGSPFELAWCNKKTGYHKIYRLMHNGVINSDGPNTKRVHPTQKPVGLFRMILQDYSEQGMTILDCFAGSGTTGVACKELGRNYILVEKEPKYVEIIHKRLQNTTVSLFHS